MPVLRRACGFALTLATTLMVAAPIAHAQDPAPPGDRTSLTSRTLGQGEQLTFRGNQDRITLTVPVPQGLSPAELTANVDLPANIARGWIDVESAGRAIGRIDLPPAPATSEPLTIPLAGALVERNSTTVTLRVTLLPLDAICPDTWFDQGTVLRDVAIAFDGEPAVPSVVADFLPPVLEQLTIYVPGSPNDAERGGAVELAAAVVAHYGTQPVSVDVRELPPQNVVPAPDPAFSRSIVVERGENARTELVPEPGSPIPALRLTGDGDALTDQIRLVTTQVAAIAVSSSAVAGSLDDAPRLTSDSATFTDLGIGELSATSHGSVTVSPILDQTRIGHAARDVGVRLQGSYTPPPGDTSGLLTVSVGDDQLASWPADASGSFDQWVTIPNGDLQRATALDVTYRTAGGTNQCGIEQPVTLTVLPQSHVEGTPTTSGPPYGFQSMPQALEPNFEIGSTTGELADLRRAVRIVAGLQSLTTVRLVPAWASAEDIASSDRPAVLVASNGTLPDSIDPPLTEDANGTFSLTYPAGDGSDSTVTLGQQTQYAALQAYWASGRGMFVASSTATPGELDRTLDWLDAVPGRWSGLSGDVLFTAQDRDPVELTADHPADPAAAAGMSTGVVAALAAVAALLVIGVVFAVVAATRRPRQHPGAEPPRTDG
ncbi:hypothetical protein [Rhodococcus rhodnii]